MYSVQVLGTIWQSVVDSQSLHAFTVILALLSGIAVITLLRDGLFAKMFTASASSSGFRPLPNVIDPETEDDDDDDTEEEEDDDCGLEEDDEDDDDDDGSPPPPPQPPPPPPPPPSDDDEDEDDDDEEDDGCSVPVKKKIGDIYGPTIC